MRLFSLSPPQIAKTSRFVSLTLQFAAKLHFLLLQAADPPLIGLCGQAVLQAALDIQVQLVLARLTRLPRQLSQASPVGEGTTGEEAGEKV